ncbi:DUF2804 domain-containing protein [Zestomonas carbonaria]|uniref:DUF2804 domain-containing protein n=1 Tax=Zestomonas carbonaria TaxID=2762745 RepID=A0A7U7IAK3_9GAMM|nr:DUF2804 domain-containing protein [Pseudomonas carbonaria]CAD5109316.1 hypothetical protein PSEWESI4_03612 [Pseudomonas carbonaria]
MTSFTSASPTFQALCDAQGNLLPAAVGWSPRPRVHCALPGHFGRRKRWNHWCITTPRWMLSLTLADLDYVGYGAAYFLDMESGEVISRTQFRPFGYGCKLPDTPLESHEFRHPHLHLRADAQPGRLRLTALAPDIGGRPLNVALDIQRPAHLESVNLVVPLGRKGFHATSRQLGLPTNGGLQLGDRQYECEPGQSFASLDFGRGVWPLRSHWMRAAFAAPGGIAGNFGSGWTDASGLSENALWFGGELLHLDCPVHLEQSQHDSLAPWRLSSDDQRVDLVFTPRQYHLAQPKVGPFHASTGQWFGHFDGVLRDPSGERVPVRSALGWLGSTHARW